MNCRSVKNKSLSINDFITSRGVDILAITETWLGSHIDNQVLKELVPMDYDIIHSPRHGKRGGGVAVIFKKGLSVKHLINYQEDVYTHFEHITCSVTAANRQFRLCVIYRPPPSKLNGLRNTIFFDEWSTYLDHQVILPQEIIITGDLNFHLDDLANADARQFSGILNSRGLIQHVTEATHTHGHTLDVVITRHGSSIIHKPVSVYDPCLCDANGNMSGDHLAVHVSLNCGQPDRPRKKVNFRKYRKIVIQEFITDIESSAALQPSDDAGVDDLVGAYMSGIKELIEKHAPLQTRVITLRPNAPWYNEKLREEKQKRRKAERLWRRTRLTIHHQMYKEQCRVVGSLVTQCKKDYYSDKIVEYGSNHSRLFRLTKDLMGQRGEIILPYRSSEQELSNKSDYSLNTISTIKREH